MLNTIAATIASLADDWGLPCCLPAGVEADAFSPGVKVLFKSFFGVLMIAFSFKNPDGRLLGKRKVSYRSTPFPLPKLGTGCGACSSCSVTPLP